MIRLYKDFLCFSLICTWYGSSLYSMDVHEEKGKIITNENQKYSLFLSEKLSTKTAEQHIGCFISKLDCLQKCVQAQEQSLYQAIKTEFKIDDDLWEVINSVIELAKEREKTLLHLPIDNVMHDENVPAYMRRMITTMLIQKDINPRRINIRPIKKSSHGTLLNTFNCFSSCSFPLWEVQGTDLIFNGSFPGEIKISPNESVESLSFLKAALTIKIELIAQQIFIAPQVLISFSTIFQKKKFNESASYKSLENNMSYIASLYAALQNTKNAHIMHRYWKSVSDSISEHSALRYFKWHAKIKRYWDCIKWLQEYEQ